MKKILFFVCTLLCANVLFAQDFYVNGVGYAINGDEVSVIGYDSNLPNELEIPSTVTNNGITYSVTSIGDEAFYYCSSLASIDIPNSVTSIGESAFYRCYSLASIDIPNSVTSIGDWAFYYCSSLTSVTLPNSVTSIGNGTFCFCSSLTSIDIPNSVTSIVDNAFYNCSSLTSVTIPNSVTSIGYEVFYNCSSLTSVTIPNSVTSIGNRAFAYCSSLTSVILPNNANISSSAFESTGGIDVGGIYYGGKEVNIGNYTFNNVGFIKFYLNGNATTITPSEVSVIDCDESLSGDIVIPSILSYQGADYSVTSIGESAFEYCSSLTSVTLPNSVTSIGEDAFYRCYSLTSIDIPNSVTSIGDWAFYYCSSLTSVTLPNSVTSIGNGTFCFCSSLTSIDIPNSVTSIVDNAFYNCSSLTSVTIPNSVTSIGFDAFSVCNNLTSVTCLAETAPSLGSSVFSSTPSTKVLNIPFGSDYSSWQGATTWSKTNYQIQKGKTKILETDFTINDTTGLINQGVLRIKQGGQLINLTTDNVSGIFEVEAVNRDDNWNYIGAPFNNYTLSSILPQTNDGNLVDVSVSLFNHNTGAWRGDWATFESEVATGESFAAWNWGTSPITFTTYGDIWNYETNQAGEYNYGTPTAFTLFNEDEITIAHQDNNSNDGVNWLSVANPYTFKLDIATIINNNELQGDVLYTYNGTNFVPVTSGEIKVTEGFFVNNTTLQFKKGQRLTNAKKLKPQRNFMHLVMKDGEREIELLFTHNEKAEQEYDRFDANKLFSPLEITEPYFVTDGNALVKEEVKELPYYATLNIKNYDSKEVTFRVDNIPEDVYVYLLDNGQDIKMNGGVKYTTNIAVGENEDRFKLLIKKARRIAEEITTDIYVQNTNRNITITTTQKDLKIEVYNALGQKVYETKNYKFTLNEVPSGAYMIKIYNKHIRENAKIVIE